jgi:hypothetical protein
VNLPPSPSPPNCGLTRTPLSCPARSRLPPTTIAVKSPRTDDSLPAASPRMTHLDLALSSFNHPPLRAEQLLHAVFVALFVIIPFAPTHIPLCLFTQHNLPGSRGPTGPDRHAQVCAAGKGGVGRGARKGVVS